MTRIIALFNQAGGVGKTTLTMNVGYHLAERGHKVLLVDMDPQASLTIFMGLKPKKLEKTIYHAVVKEEPLPIYQNINEMDLAPTNVDLSGAEKKLSDAILRDLRLKQVLDPLKEKYDFILIDCPPNLGFLSIISLIAATHVLIPIQTQYKALEGTELLIDTIQRVWKYGNSQLRLVGVIPTMFDSRASQEKMSLASIKKAFAKSKVFQTIPRATDFINASQAHIPLARYVPKHPAVNRLQEIANVLETV